MNNEEYKERITSFIRKEEDDYLIAIDKLKKQHLLIMKLFLEIDPKVMRGKDPHFYFALLLEVCKSSALFPERRVSNKLRRLGISDKLTQWFLPLKIIEQRMNIIEKKEILILKHVALMSTALFLHSKIRAQFIKERKIIADAQDEPDIDFKKMKNNLFRRREYAAGEPKSFSNVVEVELNEAARFLEDFYNDSKMAKIQLGKLFDGKTECFFFNILLRSFVPKKEMEQTEFLSRISGFFKLLSKDRIIWTKAQFEEPDSCYGNNYKRYLARRVMRISCFNPKIDDFRQFLVHSLFNEEAKLEPKHK
jgi:hypothetical protein